MTRNVFEELRVQLRTLRWLGVLRFTIDFNKCLVRENASEERSASLYLIGVVGITCSLIIYSTYYPSHFIMGKHNSTGNCYALINIRSCSVVTMLIYIQLYIQRFRFVTLLQSILRFNQISGSHRKEETFAIYYYTHLSLLIICMVNYAYGYWTAGVRLTTIPIYLLQYGFSYLFLGQVVVLFACIQQILLSILKYYNQVVLINFKSCEESRELYYNFCKYNQVIWLSYIEINHCFGLLLLLVTGLILLITPSGPFYLVSTIFEGRFRQNWQFTLMSLTAILWSLPWIVLLVFSMGRNDVQKEVGKCVYYPLK
ncbi:uncharacterized protein Dsimw501_GD28406 [Drosophila simulans]|uniref:Gustatory receptor n=1 Tax=Drosophila simulans TaxID=7240 RepID=A0A0J9R5D5_DROSI|nr:uncharacterized protein Dsimw501_GD28406 [Drosophila simulans]